MSRSYPEAKGHSTRIDESSKHVREAQESSRHSCVTLPREGQGWGRTRERQGLQMRQKGSYGQAIYHLFVVPRNLDFSSQSTGSFLKFLNRRMVRSDQF